jgi:hypothetical protein
VFSTRLAAPSLVLLVASWVLAPAPASAAPTSGTGGDIAVGPAAEPTVTLVGAGDIAVCGTNDIDLATATLVQGILDDDPTAVAFTAGDNVYPDGSPTYFANCYEPTWGAFKERTRPGIGNHEFYRNPGAAGYFEYFGARAGPAGRGYYRFNAGTWKVYSLTSECSAKSTCYLQQLKWLKSDLRNKPRECVLAIWHRPLFSTSVHGNNVRMRKVFAALYAAGAEVVVNGHDHGYQRFKPVDSLGVVDATNGIREFVVGTGGASLYDFPTDSPLIKVRDNSSHGVLELTLAAGSYSWEFLAVPGDNFTDTGRADCH